MQSRQSIGSYDHDDTQHSFIQKLRYLICMQLLRIVMYVMVKISRSATEVAWVMYYICVSVIQTGPHCEKNPPDLLHASNKGTDKHAQACLCLYCLLSGKYNGKICYIQNFNIPASLCN